MIFRNSFSSLFGADESILREDPESRRRTSESALVERSSIGIVSESDGGEHSGREPRPQGNEVSRSRRPRGVLQRKEPQEEEEEEEEEEESSKRKFKLWLLAAAFGGETEQNLYSFARNSSIHQL